MYRFIFIERDPNEDHRVLLIAPLRRIAKCGEGFKPSAVASFTTRANRLSRRSPSQNHMWNVGLNGRLDS